jgi:hypothetical protein
MVFRLFDQSTEFFEVSAKLNGIILKKAEMHNDFEGVYSFVFRRMLELQNLEGDEFLVVLGDMGG